MSKHTSPQGCSRCIPTVCACPCHDLAARLAAAEARAEALRSALERTEANFIAAVNGKPVRDMAENLAENREALRGDQ